MVVQEESDLEEEIEEELVQAEAIMSVEISLNFVVGLTNPKTLRARGSVGEQPIVVLIDPRATHNFIVKKIGGRVEDSGFGYHGPLGTIAECGPDSHRRSMFSGGSSSFAGCGNY